MSEITENEKSKQIYFLKILLILAIISCIFFTITAIDMRILSLIQHKIQRTLRNPERWINILQNSARLFAFFFALVYYICFFSTGKMLWSSTKNTFLMQKDLLFSKKSLILFAATTVFLLLAYSKVILADYYYADDVFRNYGGNRSWIGFSRYVSEFLSILIHNNLKLTDIAPLTQLLAVLVSSATVIVLSVALTSSISVKTVLCLSLIFITPFYAENISYRFDAPYMALSLFFSALPFLFKNETKSFIFTSILGLILTCISYQAALPLYILCTIYIFSLSFFKKEDMKETILFVAKALISFIVALLVFKIFFMNHMDNSSDDYFSTKIRLSSVINNAVLFIKTTSNLSGGHFMKGLLLFSLVLLFVNGIKESSLNKIFTAILIPLFIITSYILSFGPYLVFERPIFAPRAFMGFNVFISLIFLMNLSITSEKKQLIPSILVSFFVYSCLVFFFAYGNALKNQGEYEKFRVEMIAKDISEFMDKDKTVNISFKGRIDLCQKSRIAIKNHSLIMTLIPKIPSETSSWNDEILNGYKLNCTLKNAELTDSFSLIKQTIYHDIYQCENDFIIVLK